MEAAGTQEFINSLMLEFRQLVVGIQEEHTELRDKLRQNHPQRRALQSARSIIKRNHLHSTSTSATTTTTSSSTDSSSGPTPTTLTKTTSTASPIDHQPPSTNTISSGAVLSALSSFTQLSIRPPPYKSLVSALVPPVPARTRRKVTNQPATSSNRHTTTTTSTGMSAVNSVSRGALIVLEGLDRVGKSTLASKLVEHLDRTKRQVTYCRFPDRTTPIGQLINEFLTSSSKKVDDHAMHLLFSANRWEMSKRIRHTLNQGTTVIVDRYSYSGIVYSSAKRDLTMEWCAETERGLPKPDLVIYLELPKEAQYQRPGFGDERFETKEMQEIVRQRYERLMEITLEDWIRIDVDHKSPDQVLAEVILPVRRCLEKCANKELGSLVFRT